MDGPIQIINKCLPFILVFASILMLILFSVIVIDYVKSTSSVSMDAMTETSEQTVLFASAATTEVITNYNVVNITETSPHVWGVTDPIQWEAFAILPTPIAIRVL
jgi:hypothetical protein